MGRHAGQTAVVTGAGSGVGRAIAAALAVEGYQVCLLGRTPKTLAATADAIGPAGAARRYTVDLTDDDAVRRLADGLRRDVGRIDVLVHCAAVHAMGDVEASSVDEVDRQHRTNVRAPYVLTQLLLPDLRLTQGQIVFVNSSVGLAARGGVGAYAASKHALKAIADSLREEVNRDGIRVLSIYLGRTASPLQERIHAAEGKQYRPELLLQPEDVATIIVAALGLPPTAEVTDITIRPRQKPAQA